MRGRRLDDRVGELAFVARQDLLYYGRIQVRGSVDSLVLHGRDRPKNPSGGNSFQPKPGLVPECAVYILCESRSRT